MGEKEIKPADPKPQDQGTPPPYGGTQEKPGTGNPNAKSDSGSGGSGSGNKGGSGSGSGSTWSGSVSYDDGYTMGRNEAGDTYLNHPDGTSATWDSGSNSWKGSDGKTMGAGWSGGHAPADYGPQH